MPVTRIAPVLPPIRAERSYHASIKKDILDPNVRFVNASIANVGADYGAVSAAASGTLNSPDLLFQSRRISNLYVRRLFEIHSKRFRSVVRPIFRSSTNIKTPDIAIDTKLDLLKIRNDDLLKTLPSRHRQALLKEIAKVRAISPRFSYELLEEAKNNAYKTSLYNVRRIARDQTQKMYGELNHARQIQVGIRRYEWQSSLDERVRPSHIEKSGVIFEWDHPPEDTGHPGDDIQCRCVALGVVSDLI